MTRLEAMERRQDLTRLPYPVRTRLYELLPAATLHQLKRLSSLTRHELSFRPLVTDRLFMQMQENTAVVDDEGILCHYMSPCVLREMVSQSTKPIQVTSTLSVDQLNPHQIHDLTFLISGSYDSLNLTGILHIDDLTKLLTPRVQKLSISGSVQGVPSLADLFRLLNHVKQLELVLFFDNVPVNEAYQLLQQQFAIRKGSPAKCCLTLGQPDGPTCFLCAYSSEGRSQICLFGESVS